jgi:hypothetical protein
MLRDLDKYKTRKDSKPALDKLHQLNRRTELKIGKITFGYTGRKKKVDTMEE